MPNGALAPSPSAMRRWQPHLAKADARSTRISMNFVSAVSVKYKQLRINIARMRSQFATTSGLIHDQPATRALRMKRLISKASNRFFLIKPFLQDQSVRLRENHHFRERRLPASTYGELAMTKSRQGLVLAVSALDGVEELGRIIADAILEDDLDLLDVADVCGRVAVEDDEVGVLSGSD